MGKKKLPTLIMPWFYIWSISQNKLQHRCDYSKDNTPPFFLKCLKEYKQLLHHNPSKYDIARTTTLTERLLFHADTCQLDTVLSAAIYNLLGLVRCDILHKYDEAILAFKLAIDEAGQLGRLEHAIILSNMGHTYYYTARLMRASNDEKKRLLEKAYYHHNKAIELLKTLNPMSSKINPIIASIYVSYGYSLRKINDPTYLQQYLDANKLWPNQLSITLLISASLLKLEYSSSAILTSCYDMLINHQNNFMALYYLTSISIRLASFYQKTDDQFHYHYQAAHAFLDQASNALIVNTNYSSNYKLIAKSKLLILTRNLSILERGQATRSLSTVIADHLELAKKIRSAASEPPSCRSNFMSKLDYTSRLYRPRGNFSQLSQDSSNNNTVVHKPI